MITEQLLPAIILMLSQGVCCVAAAGTLNGMPLPNKVEENMEGMELNFAEHLIKNFIALMENCPFI